MKPDTPETEAGSGSPPESAGESTAQNSPWLIKHSGLGFSLTLLAVLLGLLIHQAVTWPDVRELRTENPDTTAFIERYQQRRQPGDPPLRWSWVPYDSISIHAKRAFVVGEDISFFSHEGFAIDEILVAVSEALLGERELRGASTITQQVAKNLWLSPSRNPWRKVKEALLTRQLERHLSKWRILEIYLNVAELGPGTYGVEAAAQHFFRIPASELTEQQAAQLAASLPRPSRWHPGVPSGSYERYVAEIEDRLERAEFLWRRVIPPWSKADNDHDNEQDKDKDKG